MGRRISGLKVQQHNKERVNVYLDNEFGFGLSRIVAAWLLVGQELSEDRIAELQSEDALEVAYQQAVNLISYRMRSIGEIERYLRRKDVPDSIVASVLERLERSGLVDDESFSRIWVENRVDFRPRSRRVLTMELRQKGVSDDTIRQALEGIDSEVELAYKAAEKYATRLHSPDKSIFRQKLGGFLARRGFSYDTARQVIERIWNERESIEVLES